jgi:hypothetical protein
LGGKGNWRNLEWGAVWAWQSNGDAAFVPNPTGGAGPLAVGFSANGVEIYSRLHFGNFAIVGGVEDYIPRDLDPLVNSDFKTIRSHASQQERQRGWQDPYDQSNLARTDFRIRNLLLAGPVFRPNLRCLNVPLGEELQVLHRTQVVGKLLPGSETYEMLRAGDEDARPLESHSTGDGTLQRECRQPNQRSSKA